MTKKPDNFKIIEHRKSKYDSLTYDYTEITNGKLFSMIFYPDDPTYNKTEIKRICDFMNTCKSSFASQDDFMQHKVIADGVADNYIEKFKRLEVQMVKISRDCVELSKKLDKLRGEFL